MHDSEAGVKGSKGDGKGGNDGGKGGGSPGPGHNIPFEVQSHEASTYIQAVRSGHLGRRRCGGHGCPHTSVFTKTYVQVVSKLL